MRAWRNRIERRQIVVAANRSRAWELLGINHRGQWDNNWKPMQQPSGISNEGVYLSDGQGRYELLEPFKETELDPNVNKVTDILCHIMWCCQAAGMPFERAEAIAHDICSHLENYGENSPEVARRLVEEFQGVLDAEAKTGGAK